MASARYPAQSAWRPTIATRSQVGSYTESASTPYARKLTSVISTAEVESSEETSSEDECDDDVPIVTHVPLQYPYANFLCCPPPPAGSQLVQRVIPPKISHVQRVPVASSTTASSTASPSKRKKRPARVSMLDAVFSRSVPSKTGHPRSGSSSTVQSSITIIERAPKSSQTSRTHSTIERRPKRSSTTSRTTRVSETHSHAVPASTVFSSTSRKTVPGLKTCVTCMSDDLLASRTAKLECGHRMCHTCLKRVFTLSTFDPQLMPPRCCNNDDPDAHIPLRHVDRLFDDKFKRLWNRKYAEYHTKDRLYCPTKGCATWIKPKYIKVDKESGRKVGTCKNCNHKVCKKCGTKWHGKRSCSRDDATSQVIEMAKEEGWQRCYSCKTMVQLAEGCNHMRCRCDAEFCYVCGCKWKTCDCPWFDIPDEILGSDIGLREAAHRRTRNLWDVTRYRVQEDDGGEAVVETIIETPEEDPIDHDRTSFVSRRSMQHRARLRPSSLHEVHAYGRDSESATEKDSNADVFDHRIARQLEEEEEFLAATAGMGIAALSLLDPTPSSSGRSSPRERRPRRQRHWLANRDDQTDAESSTLDERLDDVPIQALNDEWVTRLRPVQIGESLHGTDDVAAERSARARRRAPPVGTERRVYMIN